MTRILAAIHSNYPRIGDSAEQQRLRRAIAAWERGELSDEQLRSVEDEVTREIMNEQIQTGLDIVSDGQIRWYCPFSYTARALQNVSINGLLRYFDTNFYFRQPVIEGPLVWQTPILLNDYRFAASVTDQPVKVILTGPYTMARYSIVKTDHYHHETDPQLVYDYARAWAREVEALVNAGARWIQFDEPALLKPNVPWNDVRAAYKLIHNAAQDAEIAVAVFWGPLRPVWTELQNLPVERLVIDLIYGRDLLEVLATEGSPRSLGLGLIDGRNTKEDDPQALLRILEQLVPRLTHTPHLTPSCGLELLPRERARAKLENLVRIVRTFNGGQG